MRFITGCTLLALAAPAFAQVQALSNPTWTEPTAPWIWSGGYIKKTFGTPDTRVTLQGPVKLQDYVVGGKLELSLRAYLELVLANNTDIATQRLQLELPKNAIQRAFGVFDPTINASFTATRSETPTTNQLQGATVLSNLNQPLQIGFRQVLSTGTILQTNFTNTKFSTNDTFALFNPSYSTTWGANFTQPLLRGRGSYITKLPITIARAQRKQQELSFEDQLQRLLVQAENAYWDVIFARERITVQQGALDLADQSLKRARREIELGATSPLEIYQPEQQFATAKINLTQAQFNLRRAEDALRRFIAVDLEPKVRELPIVLTEKVEIELDEKPFDRDNLVQTALQRRPDLKSVVQSLDVNELQIQSSMNLLKPNFNLTGNYQTQGRGGPGFIRSSLGGAPVFRPGGIGDAYSQLFGFDFNTFAFGLTLQLPLRDRTAAANLADSLVQKKLTAFRQRSVEQTIRQEVLNAITDVENSRESVKLAKIALDYSFKRQEAEAKRYDLGVITLFQLLASQTDLVNAQNVLVNQNVTYRRNLLVLQQRLGTLLENKGVQVQP